MRLYNILPPAVLLTLRHKVKAPFCTLMAHVTALFSFFVFLSLPRLYSLLVMEENVY